MKLSPGERYKSQVCTTEIVIVRGASGIDDLSCGGVPMIPHADVPEGRTDLVIDTSRSGGSLLGKRYAHECGAEILVTKGGIGTLSAGGSDFVVKESAALPSSD